MARRSSGKKQHKQAEKNRKHKGPGPGKGPNRGRYLDEDREGLEKPQVDLGEDEATGSGFVFRDRSGKVHTIGNKRAGAPAGQSTSPGPRVDPRRGRDRDDTPRPFDLPKPRRDPKRSYEPPTPTSHSMDYLPGARERVHRPGPSPQPSPARDESAPAGRRNKFHAPVDKGRGRGQRRDSSEGRGGSKLLRLKASVDKNRKGFGFLNFEDRRYEDAFVPPHEAESLFHGDRVEVTISERGEVHDIRVLAHRFREMTGRWMPHPTRPEKGGWVVYEKKKNREQVLVPDLGEHRPKEGDWVRCKLAFEGDDEDQAGGGHARAQGHGVTAGIVEVYGPELPARADILMISNEYNLIEEHPAEAEREARSQTLEVPGKDLEGREDLRDVPFITIDGETARDFDDAVYVERTGGKAGGFVLWVAIADVSHYVREGMALDDSARSRGTSVYFPERAFHMLPRALSENLCSLRPDEPRLTLVARMEYGKDGQRAKTEIMEAVIQSKRRATYNQIQAEWEAKGKEPGWEYEPHFALYQLIRRTRAERGSIDFDFPEAELKVEPTGEVISIKNRARMDAHRLIEEFMIAANEAVTEWIMDRGWPFVYRVHDVPAMQSLEKFQTLAGNVGVDFDIGDASPKVMADLVTKLEGHPAKDLLNMALLRSMKQAVYSSVHGVHFGLASEGYTHFTSPIRRYPDLVVHRILRWALRVDKRLERPLDDRARAKLEEDLADITEHCSYRERLASDAERDANKLKQVRLMLKHLGEEFEGKVNGMTENGLFVALTGEDGPFVEGMVPRDSLQDDYYQFDDEHMVFFGKRKRRTFRIGDPVKVRVARADIDSRMIDFEMLEGGVEGRAHPAGAGGDGFKGRSERGGERKGGRDRERGGRRSGRGRAGKKAAAAARGSWEGPQPAHGQDRGKRVGQPPVAAGRASRKAGTRDASGPWQPREESAGLGRADKRRGKQPETRPAGPRFGDDSRPRKGKKDGKGRRGRK